MKCDALGNVWVSAPGGIWVYAPDGRLIGKLRVPELVSNLTWGGPDWRTLYITATHSVYAVPVKVGPRNEPYMRARPECAGRGPAGAGCRGHRQPVRSQARRAGLRGRSDRAAR